MMVSIARDSHRRVLILVVLCFTIISIIYVGGRSESIYGHASTSFDNFRDVIPNNVHYNWIMEDTDADFTFQFKHFLSVYSTWYHWRPHNIYLHVQASPESVSRARVDKNNKWNRLLLSIPNIRIHHVQAPTHVNTTTHMKINSLYHRADFIKPLALIEFGGTYLDFDAIPLRDVAVLRDSGFDNIFGREWGNTIQSGTIMAKKGTRLMRKFAGLMHTSYDGGWTSHVNLLLTWLVPRYVKYPGEALIMEQDAFTPLDWSPQAYDKIYAGHPEFPSPLNESNRATYPFEDDDESADVMERWRNPKEWHEWAHDFSSTYILHAWTIDESRGKHNIPNFAGITPRYILARQSSIARAVYPAMKHAFDRGLFGLDD